MTAVTSIPNVDTVGAALAVEEVAIERLRPDPGNPRRISDDELESLTRSLQSFGFVQPLVARREDGTVIGGHQRLVAAQRLGYQTVPVIWLDLDREHAQLLGLALNRIGGTWDQEILGRLLAELDANLGGELALSGFGSDEIAAFVRGLEVREKRERPEAFDLEAALETATRAPRTTPGTIWHLGPHVIGCGDATKPADVERLLGGRRATMAFQDPPYNVAYGDHGGAHLGRRKRRIANDALDPAAWEEFVRGWARTTLDAVDGAVYICMSGKEWPLVCRVLAEAGGHWSDTIVWAKDRFVLGRADLQRAYEPIWYGWREGADHAWYGGRDQSDVWQIDRPADAPLHPVMKPLPLIERAIENSSRPGQLVLDAFLGSGSTLIAADRTGRACAGLELDPHYCDVAVARWEAWSGLTAHAEPA